jgi:hypothetical protein
MTLLSTIARIAAFITLDLALASALAARGVAGHL